MSKSAFKNFLFNAAEKSGFLNLAQKSAHRAVQPVYVLAYHRVDEFAHRPWLDPHLISATPAQFEAQMRLVASRYHPISAQDLLCAARGRAALPKNALLVTVDDGYRDFQENMVPVCQHYGICPLLFAPTAYVGSGTFWWDKLYQIVQFSRAPSIETPGGRFPLTSQKEKAETQAKLVEILKNLPDAQCQAWVEATYQRLDLPYADQQNNTLTWDELAALSRAGVTVACHTHTHPLMTRISIEQARQEVRVSQALIRQKLGEALPIFAFPDGKGYSYSAQLVHMLHGEGFEILFLLTQGLAILQSGQQNAVFPRLSVWQSQNLAQFHYRLTPFSDYRALHPSLR